MPSVTIPLSQASYEALGRTANRLGFTTSGGRSNVRKTAQHLVETGIAPDLKPAKKRGGKPA